MEVDGRQDSTAELFSCLSDAYECLVTSSPPKHPAAHVASALFSGLCEPPAELHGARWELTCLGLTVLGRALGSAVVPGRSPCWTDVLKTLLEDMEAMSQIVRLFQTGDVVVSHLAAKTASLYVVHLLNESGTVSSVWQEKCLQAFHSSVPGTELDACLWSLTDVLKKLLKGTREAVLLGKVLVTFDPSLRALTSKLLIEDRKEEGSGFGHHRGVTVCLLLDLLEALTAASWICEAEVDLGPQTLIQSHSSALLTAVSCSSPYFVKRQILLLLKRALFQKLGEDWSLGGLKPGSGSSDTSVLARCVLTAVANNWLESVQVEPAAFFGGTRQVEAGERQKPGGVMQRAVSLVVLKSVQLQMERAGAAGGVGGASDAWSFLRGLWGFLRRCCGSPAEPRHTCGWISVLFAEQDDDLMEASLTCLSIFLAYRQSPGRDGEAVLEGACASGCNPHCHFVLLLQSVSFDHSILLDFLISAETRFLEYFVLYLKYLREDWKGFTAACRSLHASDCSSSDLSGGQRPADKAESSRCVQLVDRNVPVGDSSLGSGLRLVEYSSDESEAEDAEDPEMELGASGPFEATGLKHPGSPTAVPEEWNSSAERKAPPGRTLSGPGQASCDLSDRAVLCLSELKKVVARLHSKKLFPYNPSALLKLLSQVERRGQPS
ncbi:protein Lines homolog 1 [Menidia menidia]